MDCQDTALQENQTRNYAWYCINLLTKVEILPLDPEVLESLKRKQVENQLRVAAAALILARIRKNHRRMTTKGCGWILMHGMDHTISNR